MTNNVQPIVWNYCPICGKPLAMTDDGEKERPHCDVCRRHFYNNPTPAACCFVSRGDALLLGRRGVEPRRGYWALPGGYVELGETTRGTALRELHEETGIRAENVRLIGASSQQHPMTGAVIVLGYIVDDWHGEPRPGSDVTELEFFSKDKMPRLPFRAHRELYAIYQALRDDSGDPPPTTPETQSVVRAAHSDVPTTHPVDKPSPDK